MRRIQSIKQRSLSRNTMIVLAAVMLTVAAATDALSAGRGGGGGGGARSGHMGRGVGGPWLNNVPSLPAPIFNPLTPYTVPSSRETPSRRQVRGRFWQWLKRCAAIRRRYEPAPSVDIRVLRRVI
jgi:hypothetical protein